MKTYVVCSLGIAYRVQGETIDLSVNGVTFSNWNAAKDRREICAHFAVFEYFYEVGSVTPSTFWERLFSPTVKVTRL